MSSGFIRRLNHYDVISLLGQGGMGEVYRATDTRLGRDVALKLLPPELTSDEGRLARFQREARALASLNHPNIVTIYSVEECEGGHFITMELVEGQTLDTLIPAEGMPLQPFLSMAVPLADAVAAAHASGITHRDLKPQNVMVGREGRLKVLDFGLARFTDPSSPAAQREELPSMLRTQEGLIVGTLPYMAPEQVDGGTADARSDVYALGVVLYEMATGRRPFVRNSAVALLAAIVRDTPVPVGELAPTLPATLHRLVDRCLAKAPGDRFPHGAAVLEGLRGVAPDLFAGTVVTSFPPLSAEGVVVASTTRGRRRRSGPPLVGREGELQQLTERLADAEAGNGSLVLLGGEPGVGKTRLSEELMREAADRGMLCLVGHCQEGGSAPYGPFVEVLDAVARTLPEEVVREVLGDHLAEVGRIVPRVRRLAAAHEPAAQEPDQQRRALFAAIEDVLRRLSARQPLVLLLDDLHWGDDATVALLEQVAPGLSSLPVLCLATYRDVESDMGQPFARAMATFVRQDTTLRLPLRRLGRESVAQLLTAYARNEPPAALVDAIYQETEGNPFFVRELFQHLSEDGQLFDDGGHWKRGLTISALNVPEGVRLVIGRRLARLAEGTQAMLTAAAMIGRTFELRLVEAMGPLNGDPLLEAIEEAESAKLIVATRDQRQPRYAFTHELLRSTLLSEVSLPRRQRLHARAAAVLEQVHGPTGIAAHAQAMAHHLYEAGPAGDDARAIHYLTLASDQAIATGALESGFASIDRALTLASHGEAGGRAMLLWKHGLARRNIGQLMEAIAEWEEALPLCDPVADQVLTASICQDLAHGYAWTGRGLMGVAVAERGLAALPPGPSSHRCRLTGSLGWNHAIACDFESADPILREALAMAESLGEVQLVGEALMLTSWHYYLCMRRRDQADACWRAVELLRPTGDTGKLGEALVNWQMASAQLGRPQDIARTRAEARTLAERLGRFDIRVHQLYSEAQQDWLVSGDVEALEAGFRRVEEVAGAWRWVAEGSLSQMYLWRGDLAKAREVAEDAIAHEPPGTTHTGFGWSVAFLAACMVGERLEALDLLAQHAAELPRAGRRNTIGAWSSLLKVVEGLVIAGEQERAAAYYPLVLEAQATESVVAFDGSHLLETVAGMAALAAAAHDAAEAHFAKAIALADAMPFVSEQAEARYWLARARDGRDAAGARALAADALARYRALGYGWHARRAEALAAPAGT